MRNRSRSRAVRAPGTGGPAHFSSPRQKAHAADYPIPSASSVCQKCAWGRNVRHLCAGGRRCVSASCGTTAELLCQPGYRRPDRCWKCDPAHGEATVKGLSPLFKTAASFQCTASDKTTVVNAPNAVAVSGSSIVVRGTGMPVPRTRPSAPRNASTSRGISRPLL